jgi:hypothetical protein
MVLDGGIFTSIRRSKDNILYFCRQPTSTSRQTALTGFILASPSIIETVMIATPPRVRFVPPLTRLLHAGTARIAHAGVHSGPEFDKLILRMEDGAALGLDVPNRRQRVKSFVGA